MTIHKTPRLLLVDDEENILNSLNRALRGENYQILTARNAVEAINVMVQSGAEMVITDYQMPGISGIELLKEIKTRWPDTIRCLITGQADLDGAIEAINEGRIYRFILKPWNNEELRLIISQALKYQDLLKENQKLLKTLTAQEKLLKKIEMENPGITQIQRSVNGAIIIDEDEDYSDIMKRMAI
ncbi:MAG: hypothetical protein A2161_02445 [Candidatus Schekmanbacteria bacterium RBG_13_48_7]|uniref:Response regulatory domain-containing protein n=1 Tax=Candidatus Schekmanbacteria bacterium RBG_13_48_7 TaxID=1817878 RepID=A0A1F7RZN6_9BACT|nr:MAG: hypothetical protein A2161_02445 [Candidatus Schekmanbacteria bacterium RBG_13_48_7]